MAFKKAVAANEMIKLISDRANDVVSNLTSINNSVSSNIDTNNLFGYEIRSALSEVEKLSKLLDTVKKDYELRDYDSKLVKEANTQRNRADSLQIKLDELQDKYNKELERNRLRNIDDEVKVINNNIDNIVCKVAKNLGVDNEELVEIICNLLKTNDEVEKYMVSLKEIVSNYETSVFERNSKEVKQGKFKPALRADINDEELSKAYMNGLTPYKIAKQVGCTQQTVINRLKGLGIYKGRKE